MTYVLFGHKNGGTMGTDKTQSGKINIKLCVALQSKTPPPPTVRSQTVAPLGRGGKAILTNIVN